MNTSAAAQILDQVSAILKKLPDMELLTALRYIEHLADIATQPEGHVFSPIPDRITGSTPTPAVSPIDLIEQLQDVDTPDLERFIKTSGAWKKKSALQDLAKQLNLSFTTRTTKEELLQLIVTHFEMSRMHSLIRTYQSTPSNELQSSIL